MLWAGFGQSQPVKPAILSNKRNKTVRDGRFSDNRDLRVRLLPCREFSNFYAQSIPFSRGEYPVHPPVYPRESGSHDAAWLYPVSVQGTQRGIEGHGTGGNHEQEIPLELDIKMEVHRAILLEIIVAETESK